MSASWIDVLRLACESTSQRAVGIRIGYSAAVVNQVLKGTYTYDLRPIQKAVERELMPQVVDCPVVGDIPRAKCLEHQDSPFRATNPMAVQIYSACRSGCANSLIKADPSGKETS